MVQAAHTHTHTITSIVHGEQHGSAPAPRMPPIPPVMCVQHAAGARVLPRVLARMHGKRWLCVAVCALAPDDAVCCVGSGTASAQASACRACAPAECAARDGQRLATTHARDPASDAALMCCQSDLPMMVGSSSGCFLLAGMIARPRATCDSARCVAKHVHTAVTAHTSARHGAPARDALHALRPLVTRHSSLLTRTSLLTNSASMPSRAATNAISSVTTPALRQVV
jgi:hypothetical protein